MGVVKIWESRTVAEALIECSHLLEELVSISGPMRYSEADGAQEQKEAHGNLKGVEFIINAAQAPIIKVKPKDVYI